MGKLGYKGLLLLGGMMMLGEAAQAQYLRSSYFMEGTSARLQLNPGLQPTRGYFNVPIIGSFNMSASSNLMCWVQATLLTLWILEVTYIQMTSCLTV